MIRDREKTTKATVYAFGGLTKNLVNESNMMMSIINDIEMLKFDKDSDDFSRYRWVLLQVKLPIAGVDFGCIEHRDSNDILIFGGWNQKSMTSVYQLNTSTLSVSSKEDMDQADFFLVNGSSIENSTDSDLDFILGYNFLH